MSDLTKLEAVVSKLANEVNEVKKQVAGLKIDTQLVMMADNKIKPGIGTKVSYDKYGRITGTLPLTAEDIPSIQMNKVSGLAELVDDKASKSDIEKVRTIADQISKHGETVKTGSVVNIDKNGLVNEVHDLLPSDIPELTIDKISGLQDVIDQLSSAEHHNDEYVHDEVQPGTGVKIEYDHFGHVINSHPLEQADLPPEVIKSITDIGDTLRTVQSTLDTINESIRSLSTEKIDKPYESVTPGIYTRVSVDKNGLITSGENITLDDIPAIPIRHVARLEDVLNSKAETDMVQTVSDEIYHKMNKMENRIRELETTLATYPSVEEFRKLKHSNEELTQLVNTLLTSIPGDQILTELDSVKADISAIQGQIYHLSSDDK